MLMPIVVVVLVLVALLGAGALAAQWWNAESNRTMARLTRAMPRAAARTLQPGDLDALPRPVARYLRERLPPNQRLIRRAQIWTSGEFLIRPGTSGWRRFRAKQLFTWQPAGYVWDARIRMLPGLDIFVRDALVAGEGSIRAAVAGLVPLVSSRGSPGLAAGASHRFLAEALWFPTALVLNPILRWVPIDDDKARVTLEQGATTVALEYRFGPDGLPVSVFAPDRFREQGGRGIPTPWQVRFLRHEIRGGMMIPVSAVVEWLLPSGPLAYWRGTVGEVRYEF